MADPRRIAGEPRPLQAGPVEAAPREEGLRASEGGYFADPELAITKQDGPTFELHVNALAGAMTHLGPTPPDVAMYRVGGASQTQHALFTSAPFLSGMQGAALLQWVGEMVSLDPMPADVETVDVEAKTKS